MCARALVCVQRVVVDGKIVSQLCDDEGNMTAQEFKEAMRKQVRREQLGE